MAGEVHDLLALLSVEHDFHRRWEIRRDIEKAPHAVTVLRDIRRHGPGRVRAAALDALMHLEGESGLDPADVAAVERLIRLRQRTDPLGPVMSIETTWWCVRDVDQTTVMASLGLTSPRPVTYKLASSVMEIIDSDASTRPTMWPPWSASTSDGSTLMTPSSTAARCWLPCQALGLAR